jgi:hypothetical protein
MPSLEPTALTDCTLSVALGRRGSAQALAFTSTTGGKTVRHHHGYGEL